MKNNLPLLLKNVKLFLFDLDGVLIHNKSGNEDPGPFLKEIKKFSEEIKKYGLSFGIVSAREEDELISELKKDSSITVISSSLEKVNEVEKLITRLSIGFSNLFYAGDEVLDLPLLSKCGVSAAPSWAGRNVKRSVKYIIKGPDTASMLTEILGLIKSAHSNN